MSGKRSFYTAYDRDQVAKWKSAIAESRRQQRNRRGERRRGIQAMTGVGMVRLQPSVPASRGGPNRKAQHEHCGNARASRPRA